MCSNTDHGFSASQHDMMRLSWTKVETPCHIHSFASWDSCLFYLFRVKTWFKIQSWYVCLSAELSFSNSCFCTSTSTSSLSCCKFGQNAFWLDFCLQNHCLTGTCETLIVMLSSAVNSANTESHWLSWEILKPAGAQLQPLFSERNLFNYEQLLRVKSCAQSATIPMGRLSWSW